MFLDVVKASINTFFLESTDKIVLLLRKVMDIKEYQPLETVFQLHSFKDP